MKKCSGCGVDRRIYYRVLGAFWYVKRLAFKEAWLRLVGKYQIIHGKFYCPDCCMWERWSQGLVTGERGEN